MPVSAVSIELVHCANAFCLTPERFCSLALSAHPRHSLDLVRCLNRAQASGLSLRPIYTRILSTSTFRCSELVCKTTSRVQPRGAQADCARYGLRPADRSRLTDSRALPSARTRPEQLRPAPERSKHI